MSQDYTRPWGFTDQQNKQGPYSVEGSQENLLDRQCAMCFGKGITGAQVSPDLRIRAPLTQRFSKAFFSQHGTNSALKS